MQHILDNIWEIADLSPFQCLLWLSELVGRHKTINNWVVRTLSTWAETYLLAHDNQRVRSAACSLFVNLVPSCQFQGAWKAWRVGHSPNRDLIPNMTPEAVAVTQTIFRSLLRLMPKAKKFAEPSAHSANKLVQYFSMLTFCLLTKAEKLAFSEYFKEFWNLFYPEMCQSKIQQHLNKQALLVFWYHACQDCPENVAHIYRNKEVSQKLPFNYIMVDNDDQELVAFNKLTLPAYYGLLRLASQQNRFFLKTLSTHENMEWAFKNIAAHSSIYVNAAEELFLMMEIFAEKPPTPPPGASIASIENHKEEQIRASTFRKNTLATFLNSYQKGQWQTLITVSV